jgi:GNAT superfamily N-acetyltransferase
MIPGLEIREAQLGEEPELLSMYEWLFDPPGSRPRGFEPGRAVAAIAETIAGREATILIAAQHDLRIGFCSAYLDINSVRYGKRVWVEDLAVDPGHRSRGVGRALLGAAREWGRRHGATHLELDSGADRGDAHRFYERESPDWTGKQYAWLLGR